MVYEKIRLIMFERSPTRFGGRASWKGSPTLDQLLMIIILYGTRFISRLTVVDFNPTLLISCSSISSWRLLILHWFSKTVRKRNGAHSCISPIFKVCFGSLKVNVTLCPIGIEYVA